MYTSYALVLLTVLVLAGLAVLAAVAMTAVNERRAASRLPAVRSIAPRAPSALKRAA